MLSKNAHNNSIQKVIPIDNNPIIIVLSDGLFIIIKTEVSIIINTIPYSEKSHILKNVHIETDNIHPIIIGTSFNSLILIFSTNRKINTEQIKFIVVVKVYRNAIKQS